MAFTGGSILQAAQLSTINTDVSTINTDKLAVSVFDLYRTGISSIVSSIDAKNNNQDSRLGTAEGNISTLRSDVDLLSTNKVNVSVYDTKISEIGTKDTEQDDRLVTISSNISGLKSRTTVIEGRAGVVEGRIGALEGRVTTLETSKINVLTYNNVILSISSTNNDQDNRLSTISSNISTLQDFTSSIEGHASTLEAIKVNELVYDNAILSISSTNTEQDGRISIISSNISTLDSRTSSINNQKSNLDTNTVYISNYNEMVSSISSADNVQYSRLSTISSNINTLSSSKVDASDYISKISTIDAKNTDQDIRLTTIEGEVSSITADISGRVQNEINDKVTTIFFSTIEGELINVDSGLKIGIDATVSTLVQLDIDQGQSTVISTKVDQTEYNSTISSIDRLNSIQTNRLNLYETNRVNTTEYNSNRGELNYKDYFFERKLLSIYEFIQVMLNTYKITKLDENGNENEYKFTSNIQNLPTAPEYFTIINKASNAIGISLSNMLFNTMMGDFALLDSSNNVLTNINSFTVSSTSVVLTNSTDFTDAQFPLKIAYRDSKQTIVSSVTLTKTQYTNLSNLSNVSNTPLVNNIGWATSIGGTALDQGYGIAVDGNGNVYVTGFYTGTVTINNFTYVLGAISVTPFGTLTNAGGNDCFIVKYSSSGQVQWATSINGTASDTGIGIAVNTDGNVYVTGFYTSTVSFRNFSNVTEGAITTSVYGTLTNAGGNDCFIVKYSSSGQAQWATSIGGTGTDLGRSIAVVKDVNGNDNIYVTGQYSTPSVTINSYLSVSETKVINSVQFGVVTISSIETLIIKYDKDGQAQWVSGISNSSGRSIAVDGGGNVYVTGSGNSLIIRSFASYVLGGAITRTTYGTLTTAGLEDCFIVKYDKDGQAQWATNIGGSSNDQGLGIAVDATGNVYVTGIYSSANVTIRNSTPPPVAGGIITTSVYGTLANNITTGTSNDCFIVKYNTLGQAQWATSISGIGSSDQGNSIAVDTTGNVYVTGQYAGSVLINNFNSISNEFINTPLYVTLGNNNTSNLDCFIVKYDKDGQAQWATNIGGSSSDYGYGIAVDATGNLYITGSYEGTVQFNSFNNIINRSVYTTAVGTLTSAGSLDAFIAKYNTNGKLLLS
jgi:hypothetical protein